MVGTIDRHTIAATIEPLGISPVITAADILLDADRYPYIRATLTCKLPDEADRTAIDLRTEGYLRLSLNIRRDFGKTWALADLTAAGLGALDEWTTLFGGQPLSVLTSAFYVPWNGALARSSQRRTFDLFLLERAYDDVAKEMTLTAVSDEAYLVNGALVDDAPYDPSSTDLATIVEAILARYGLELSLDSETATVAEADATIQKPGEADWEYLHPMIEAASLRLWADEAGTFTISPRPLNLDGGISLTGSGTMTRHVDTMTLDPELWWDAVIVHYSWLDALGATLEAWDVAGAFPSKAARIEERPNTVYPGVGAAAGILARGEGRGRKLEIAAVSDYDASPGVPAIITPPDTITQTGYLGSVRFRFPDGEMDVTTRELVDTPADAYLFGDETTFADVAISNPTLDIDDFEWSLV